MSHYQWAQDKTLILNLRVMPGAQESNFAGLADGYLRIRLHAQARDNEANDALIKYLSKVFNMPKSQITILSGAKSRLKRVALADPKTLPPEAEIA